ncbi:hypothetical protein [Massilia sp. Mn16-1_5]|uniref:hypothetical protein n=1 Tax=Massilia sp. Mn16-1_5 TaxID=2079199 RepID=UPI00109E81C6|nr:hypothetical protein [Massilia sp. Mn16-1_5]THC40005.1 hypothetical protein C2862_22635 [Massilia sp. Mn16-1_5]
MALIVGALVALGVGLLAALAGLGRERSFYPTIVIVIASYYVLFAAETMSPAVLAVECAGLVLFTGLAIGAFKRSLWLAVAALAAHGLFDYFHQHIVDNPGVPAWWPPFCLAYDVAAAAFLAWQLVAGKLRAAPLAER